MTTFIYQRVTSSGLVRKTCAAAIWLLLSAAILDCGSASDAYVPLRPARSIPLDGVTYAFIGREALSQYGYEEIIERAVDAGFLRYPEQMNAQNLVGQTMADAVSQAWPVFTKGAVAAGITALLDSPAPGPADAIAIGMLVVALIDAGAVIGKALSSSATATATPVPTATAIPTATATTTTTSPPIDLPRKYPNQTCDEKVRIGLQAAMKAVCKGFPGEPCRPTRDNAERLPLYACSLIMARIAAVNVCVAARQKVQDVCFKNAPEPGHEQQIDDLTKGIMWCAALKATNCAPGHPMSGL